MASIGFLVFWKTESVFVGLSGLFITGLGVQSYPLILSLAIGAGVGNTVQASAPPLWHPAQQFWLFLWL